MAKRKPGLHKDVSTIFDGVPLPKKQGEQAPAATGVFDRGSCAPPRTRPADYRSPAGSKPQQAAAYPTGPKSKPRTAPMAKVAIPGKSRLDVFKKTWEQIKSKAFARKAGVGNVRQKVMVVLIPVFFVVLIFVLAGVLSSSSPTAATLPKPEAVSAGGYKIDWQIPEPYPTTLRDPMTDAASQRPADGSTIEMGELVIKGILHSADKPAVIIGTHLLHEGDEVSVRRDDEVLPATVLKINQDSVEFEMSGETWTQRIKP